MQTRLTHCTTNYTTHNPMLSKPQQRSHTIAVISYTTQQNVVIFCPERYHELLELSINDSSLLRQSSRSLNTCKGWHSVLVSPTSNSTSRVLQTASRSRWTRCVNRLTRNILDSTRKRQTVARNGRSSCDVQLGNTRRSRGEEHDELNLHGLSEAYFPPFRVSLSYSGTYWWGGLDARRRGVRRRRRRRRCGRWHSLHACRGRLQGYRGVSPCLVHCVFPTGAGTSARRTLWPRGPQHDPSQSRWPR